MRASVLWAAAAILAAVVSPPLLRLSSRYGFVEAAQFSALSLVIPLLVVLGRPWGARPLSVITKRVGRWRRERPGPGWVAAVIAPALAVEVLWRTPLLVDRLARDHALLLAEVVTLVPAGTAIWLECVTSSPLVPRLSPPGRIVVIAISMWTVWVLAYAVGLSTSDVYPAYRHVAHRVVGVETDQQITAGLMWFLSAACFMPPAFLTLMSWLRGEQRRPSEADHRTARGKPHLPDLS